VLFHLVALSGGWNDTALRPIGGNGIFRSEDRPQENQTMAFPRISVVGCSGAGKSTLARRLSALLECRCLELDSVYHQSDWTPIDEPSFLNRVDEFT